MQAALHCFPDICSTFPFCVAGKGSGMEKVLPRPLRPHGKGGEQSVRSPPATVGHICGQLSPCCSLRRSAAQQLCTLLPSPCAVSYCLSHAQIQKLVTRTTRKDALSPHSLCPPPSSFPRLFILMGLTHEKGSPLCRNEGEGSGYISRAVYRCPSHSGQNG